ncbi:lytic murein transglycosylase [Algihabitans albus]|uniref:lytic murein transglycosylase n=1 Tax=Algihabitans albus TaxID=2164067 RepID=UPI000E5CD2A9|nr:lytic murein transglycosylase [Algihabitans albus]
MRRLRHLLPVLVISVLALPAAAAEQPFEVWLADFQARAQAEGIEAATLGRAFAGVQPIPRIIELDRRQPEFVLSFWRYLGNAVTPERIAQGQALLREHEVLLTQVERTYGVQARFLVAFWGLETNYGATFGSFPVIGALSTLAWDGRRRAFFEAQLLDALRILQAGDIDPARMEGSWAGAMGHLQFIPSTFTGHAIDGDGDGRRDIWGSLPDVFASAANYLSTLGWNGEETWGREVLLPDDFDYDLVSIATLPETVKSLTDWTALGVRSADGTALPRADVSGGLILPAGAEGPAFLVYENYRHILSWNRSILYAVAIGHLADRLIGLPEMRSQPPADQRRLAVEEVKEIQQRLADLGFDVGEPDGRVGPQTRNAIRDFQSSAGLPADAFASPALLEELRRRSQG